MKLRFLNIFIHSHKGEPHTGRRKGGGRGVVGDKETHNHRTQKHSGIPANTADGRQEMRKSHFRRVRGGSSGGSWSSSGPAAPRCGGISSGWSTSATPGLPDSGKGGHIIIVAAVRRRSGNRSRAHRMTLNVEVSQPHADVNQCRHTVDAAPVGLLEDGKQPLHPPKEVLHDDPVAPNSPVVVCLGGSKLGAWFPMWSRASAEGHQHLAVVNALISAIGKQGVVPNCPWLIPVGRQPKGSFRPALVPDALVMHGTWEHLRNTIIGEGGINNDV